MYRYLLPHFFPAGRFLILHLFGIVIAMAGLIPACFAKGDNKTAHRHFGAVLIKAPTLVQQVGGTLALTFLAELKHGLKLVAADLIGVFPHSPAAPTSSKNALEATRNTNTQTRQPFILFNLLCNVLIARLRSFGSYVLYTDPHTYIYIA